MLNLAKFRYNDGANEPYINFTIAPDNRMIRGFYVTGYPSNHSHRYT